MLWTNFFDRKLDDIVQLNVLLSQAGTNEVLIR